MAAPEPKGNEKEEPKKPSKESYNKKFRHYVKVKKRITGGKPTGKPPKK